MQVEELLRKFPLISDQVEPKELLIILTELEQVLANKVPGDVVEFGCYAGTTSLFIQRLLQNKKQFHVYDSFEGLPEKMRQDQSPVGEQFKRGELAVSKNKFITNFKRANLPLPRVHKAWFDDLTPIDVPKHIAFAFLDGDYYESVLTPLKLIWPNLSPGATVIVDDYQNEALPGAAKAVDEWLKSHSADLRIEASLAIIKP